MAALERLLAQIMARWQIAPERVIGHSDMSIGRKSDPGPRFDWRRLALRGLSVWPETGGCAGDFVTDARAFGYSADQDIEALLVAVRLRFRPWASGPMDDTDRVILHDLASRYPVDPKGVLRLNRRGAEGRMAAGLATGARKVRTPQGNGAG